LESMMCSAFGSGWFNVLQETLQTTGGKPGDGE